jgi:hypothetical protein
MTTGFDLSAWLNQYTPTIPVGTVNHLASLSRVYLRAYLLEPSDGKTRDAGFARGPAVPEVWMKALRQAQAERGLKLFAVVESRPGSPRVAAEARKSVFGDPTVSKTAIEKLVEMAKEDGYDGLILLLYGWNLEGTGSYAGWIRELKRSASGMEVDVSIPAATNTMSPGFVDYAAVANAADHLELQRSWALYLGGTLSFAPDTQLDDQLSYARERVPLGRLQLDVLCGGLYLAGARIHPFGPDEWPGIRRDVGSPVRRPDGALSGDLQNGQFIFADAVSMVRSLERAKKEGFSGAVLESLAFVDPDFWRWWDMNRAVLQGAAKP